MELHELHQVINVFVDLLRHTDFVAGFLVAIIFGAYRLIRPISLNFVIVNLLSLAFLIIMYNLDTIVVAGIITLFIFGLCQGIERLTGRIRWVFALIGVLSAVGLLAVYKYSLIREGIEFLYPSFSLTVQIFGISYFTFKLIHVIVDTYCRRIEAVRLSSLLSYIFFFPAFLSGPIDRYQNFSGFRRHWGTIAEQDVNYGLERIIYGLFQKFVLADYIRDWIIPVLGNIYQFPQGYVALCAAMYSFQLYFDFAGYSNLAIGTARLFGYRLPENFNLPYLKRNLREFWRSWHMSLTSWLRDYVYIPLGGSRRSYCRTLLNTLVLMAVCGIWHGSTWNFLIWGVYHGLGLVAVRVYGSLLQTLPDARLWNQLKTFLKHSWFSYAVSLVMTFIFVAVGWVFFFNSWEASLQIIRYVVSGD